MGVRAKTDKKTSRSQVKNNKVSKEYNYADVCIRMIDALYDLAQTGNLVGLILFAVVLWVFFVTYKLPPEAIQRGFGFLGDFLSSERYYIFPLGGALSFSVFVNFYQARIYRSHINDLTDHRKVLVHGLDSGLLQPLRRHSTTSFDIESNEIND